MTMGQHKTTTANFTVTIEYGDGWDKPEEYALDIADAIRQLGKLHNGYDYDYAVVKVDVKHPRKPRHNH